MIPSYPKVFTVGDRHTLNLFKGPVQITEKVDGSQFAFGKIDNELHFRSKGTNSIYLENCQKLLPDSHGFKQESREILDFLRKKSFGCEKVGYCLLREQRLWRIIFGNMAGDF